MYIKNKKNTDKIKQVLQKKEVKKFFQKEKK